MWCVLVLYMRGSIYSLTLSLNARFLNNFSWQFFLIYFQSFLCQKPGLHTLLFISPMLDVVCVNFIHAWQYLQFNIISERQIFKQFFMAVFFNFLSELFCQKTANRKLPKEIFLFKFGLGSN